MTCKATTRTDLPPIPWFDPQPEPVVIELDPEAGWKAWESAWAELDELEQTS
jgi:hypothetical protein